MAKKKEVNLEELEALGAKGYSVTMICEAIGINRTTAYARNDIINAIKAGTLKAKQRVIDDLLSRSESDQSSTASIFLAKKLKVFDKYFPTATPKSTKDAVNKIADIYTAVARNELDEDRGVYLVGFLEKYIKGYEVTELEKRIQALEGEK